MNMMSMRALNKLVGRSMMDPIMLRAFDASRVEDLLYELDFAPELRERLSGIQAGSLQEFAVQSYAIVAEFETGPVRMELPHPAEGLILEDEVLAIAA
jgi:hypothetical protein